MRESNYSYAPQNRATISITHLLYDRRALDTSSPLAILNNLTSLTYLTQTSPRIREILTQDGGLERLIDILRESCYFHKQTLTQDWWGLNGPPTARVIDHDRGLALRHSLAFQCVVNIGVRGSEQIRTRVVQAGALDIVAQILETWLKQRGVSIFVGSLGSQAAVDARAAGLPIPGVDTDELVTRWSRTGHAHQTSGGTIRAGSIAQFVSNLTGIRPPSRPSTNDSVASEARGGDTDVDMADAEGGDETTDGGSAVGADDSMDVDETPATQSHHNMQQDEPEEPQAGPSTTPRARQTLLPMPMHIPGRTIYSQPRETLSQTSSAGTSLSGEESARLPRATSDNDLAVSSTAGAQINRPAPLNLAAPRLPALAQDPISTQSSPMGTPTRSENAEGVRSRGRRGTIVGRQINVNLAPRNDRRRDLEAGSGTSDGGEDVDLPAAIVAAGIAAANAQAMEGGGTVVPDDPGLPPNVEIVEGEDGLLAEEPDLEAIAAEQARLDMEAGAPPGQPGAAQTPRVTNAPEGTVPLAPVTGTAEQTQIIIANGAPRGFHDLGSYVGISSLLNPGNDQYSDDSILLALQLLAYLSKYPHVRSAFHHPRRPMHPTFDLGTDPKELPLPERPAISQTPNVFSLVERFTFRPSPTDPLLPQLPKEIQYWAGVIMRNACRKDEAKGGLRQCANMVCGKWEKFPRQFAKCRRCRKAKYCSKECQSRAWSDGHRFWCNSRSDDLPNNPDAVGTSNPRADDDDDDLGETEIPPEIIARIRAARHNAARGRTEVAHPGFPTPEDIPPRLRETVDRGRGGANDIPDDMQQALLRQSLGPGATTTAAPRYPGPEINWRRDDRARSRTAEGPSRAAMALAGATMRDIAEARLRTQSHNVNEVPSRRTRQDGEIGIQVENVSPVHRDASLYRDAPPAPRLAHRVPGPPLSEHVTPGSVAGQLRSPTDISPSAHNRPLTPVPGPSFTSHATSPTPTTAVPGMDGLLPALYSGPLLSSNNNTAGSSRQR